MKWPAWLDRTLDGFQLVYRPWIRRFAMVHMSEITVVNAARLVASLAPAEPVQDYIAACTDGIRQYERWTYRITAIGGCVPGFMWAAGIALHLPYAWGIVYAQLAWFVLWLVFGEPYMRLSLEAQRVDVHAAALAELAQHVDPTQEQLNAAAVRLGLPHVMITRDD